MTNKDTRGIADGSAQDRSAAARKDVAFAAVLFLWTESVLRSWLLSRRGRGDCSPEHWPLIIPVFGISLLTCKDDRANPDRQPQGVERQVRPCTYWPVTQPEVQPADIRARYDSLFPTRLNPEASLSWAPVVPAFTGNEGLGGTWRHVVNVAGP